MTDEQWKMLAAQAEKLDAISDLHVEQESDKGSNYCKECFDDFPCATKRILDW